MLLQNAFTSEEDLMTPVQRVDTCFFFVDDIKTTLPVPERYHVNSNVVFLSCFALE